MLVLYCLDRSTMTNASPMLPISRPTTLAIPDASMSVMMALFPGFRTSTASRGSTVRRPEIPLSDLTADCLDRLPALIDPWITDARAHAAEPEATTET